MDFGVNVFVTDRGIHPVTAAQATEAAGLTSIFVGDHTHIPAETAAGNAMITDCYARFADVFTALTAMAVSTTRVQLGTGICLIPQREPIGLAKQVATLDQLSEGRLVLGVGAGWNPLETANHGVDPARRFALMGERILAMQAIWAQDVAEYRGEHVQFGPLLSWPKPHQRPWPPVLVAGRGPKVFDRVLAYGDGWCPEAVGGLEPIAALTPLMSEFQRRREDCPRPLTATVMGVSIDEACVAAVLELGFDRCTFDVPDGTAGEIEEQIGRAGELAGRFV